MKKVNENLELVTIEDIENHKRISDSELNRDLKSLRDFDSRSNQNSFYGNPFLYHFQLKNLLKCYRDNGCSLYDLWDKKDKRQKLLTDTLKRDRGGRTPAGNIYECFRANTGSVVMFKATTAKYLYQKYGGTSILDPTAGWGGRMLGAWALNLRYTGIDTNLELKPAYDKMIQHISYFDNKGLFASDNKLEMIFDSCLDVDYSNIEYDMVLTSPPYINMEIYEHMKEWNSDLAFYKDFLIPLLEKCRTDITKGGYIAFNISPKMYEDGVKHGLPICDVEEDLLQQLGQQKKMKQDKIYIWK